MADFRREENSASGFRAGDKLIFVLLLIFILRGLIYATVIPLWHAPDEPGHYQAAQRVAAQVYPWFEPDMLYGGTRVAYGGVAQGYYWLAGLVGLLPVISKGVVVRAYALRLLSIFLSTIAVYFTYRTAREIFPDKRIVYLGAPLAMAMLPMYTFTGMSINADNLAIPIFSIFLWLAVRTIRKGLEPLALLLMVITVAVGLLTKRTTFAAVPLLAVLPFFYIFRQPAVNNVQRFFRFVPIIMATIGLMVMLPYLTGMSTTFARLDFFTFIRGGLAVNPDQLEAPRSMLMSTFWGKFGWADVPLPNYEGFKNVWRYPVIGYASLLVISVLTQKSVLNRVQLVALSFLALAVTSVLFVALVYQPATGAGIEQWLPQARYVWTVLGAGALLFVVGTVYAFSSLIGAVKERFRFPGIRTEVVKSVLGLAALLFLVVAMFRFDYSVFFNVVAPQYFTVFSPNAVELRDPVSVVPDSLIEALRVLEMTRTDFRQLVSWRPALFTSGTFFALLYSTYIVTLGGFLAGIARAEWRDLKDAGSSKGPGSEGVA